ncbi:MAG: hypothetical protein GXP62_08120 [Oligoflexia bacterium]|nr:hypothetical protein [Oligoflexia bacterium]
MGCGNDMQRFGGGSRNLPGGVRWFDLLLGETVIATTLGGNTFDEKVLECPELEEIGPALQELAVHLEMRGRTGNFECQVAIQYKYADGEWSQVQAGDVVLSLVSADGYPAPAVFIDRSRLGRRRIRLVLQYRTAAGGTVGDRALLRIGVACRPFCC